MNYQDGGYQMNATDLATKIKEVADKRKAEKSKQEKKSEWTRQEMQKQGIVIY